MGKPLYRQVEEQMRLLIAEGAFADGSLLPSVRDLAVKFNTNVFNIHKALTPLEHDGLIERRRKLGTVVTKGSPKLACVGLYFSSSFIYDGEMGFYRSLCEKLVSKLDSLDWGHRIWTETIGQGDSRVRGSQIKAVELAVEKGQIQGLIAPMTNSPAFDSFVKLKIPSSFIGSGMIPNKVIYDYEEMLRLSLRRLKEQGCRSVGLISNMYGKASQKKTLPDHEYAQFHKNFLRLADEFGLMAHDKWIRCPEPGIIPQSQVRFGYEQFSELWSQGSRPEGLLVYSDITAMGVVTSILEHRVEVPRDLKLVLHKNNGIEHLCPLPVSWVVSDVQAVADALIDLIKVQSAGQAVEPRKIAFTLE